MRKSIRERFLAKVVKTRTCWFWIGSDNGYGYGKLGINKKTISAHRFAWEVTYGRIPDGMFVCHRCDNPSCVNPKHLFIGTAKDNMTDARIKGRIKGRPRKIRPWIDTRDFTYHDGA